MPERADGRPFDLRNVAHAIIANRLMMLRRGNPAMGGPSSQDYERAADLIHEMESHGLRITSAEDGD